MLLQALRHFMREASVGLLRSWRVSVLAVFTITVSLFLAGLFLLAGRNLSRTVSDWKQEARFVVYLDPQVSADDRARLEGALRQAPWVTGIEFVTPAESALRFRQAFPSLTSLVEDARYGSLPASIEVQMRKLTAADSAAFRSWQETLKALPSVQMLDDDRDWIGDVEALIRIVEAVGSLLGIILIGASVFTIAAVVRLTSFLYRDEISVMRLVGATEFYIRGPFLVEGILQGLIGALLALAALKGVHWALASQFADSLLLKLLVRDFLSLPELAGLLAFGSAAGLAGALVSVGREVPSSEQD